MKLLLEQISKPGQVFFGSKFAGVASMATAFGGTGLPPCAAYDFSCPVRGTFALTVEPGEKAVPAKLREACAASAPNVAMTFRVTTNCPTKANLFKKLLSCITCGKP